MSVAAIGRVGRCLCRFHREIQHGEKTIKSGGYSVFRISKSEIRIRHQTILGTTHYNSNFPATIIMPCMIPATISMPSYIMPASMSLPHRPYPPLSPLYTTPPPSKAIVPNMNSQTQQDTIYDSLTPACKAAIDRAIALASKRHPREAMKDFVDDGRKIGFWNTSKMAINIHDNIDDWDFRQVLFFYSSG